MTPHLSLNDVHPLTLTWSPRDVDQVVLDGRGMQLLVPLARVAEVLGTGAASQLRLRGQVSLLVFDDELRRLRAP